MSKCHARKLCWIAAKAAGPEYLPRDETICSAIGPPHL